MNAAMDEVFNDVYDVDGVLNYTINTGVRPVSYTYDPPPGVARNSLRDREFLAPDRRPGAAGAAGGVRCAQHRSQRSAARRPQVSGLDR